MKSKLNGNKATGPKTPEGKSISSKNAVKHQILSDCITEYDKMNMTEIYNGFADEFGEETPSKRLLLQQLTLVELRLQRCVIAETELLREALNPHITKMVNPLDLPDIHKLVVVKQGEPARLSTAALERFSLIYERYEPRLVARALKLIKALKENEKT